MRADAYVLQDTADSLIRQLETAGVEDKSAERTSKVLLTIMIVAWICAFWGSILALANKLPWLALPLIAVPIALSYAYSRTKRHDLDDRKWTSVLRFLRMLRADIPQNEIVTVQIDFRDHVRGGRLVSKRGSMFGKKLKIYEHAWLEMHARLADGNEIGIAVTLHVKRKEKPKRKYTKVRERRTETLELTAKLGKVFGDAERMEQRLKAAPGPQGLNLRRVSHAGSRLRAVLATPVALTDIGRGPASNMGENKLVSGDLLLQSLLWFYSGISGAHRAA